MDGRHHAALRNSDTSQQLYELFVAQDDEQEVPRDDVSLLLLLLSSFPSELQQFCSKVLENSGEVDGRPALTKFMAVTHHAYNTLKMPSTWGVLAIETDTKDAVACVQQIFKDITATVPGEKGELGAGGSNEAPPPRSYVTPGNTFPMAARTRARVCSWVNTKLKREAGAERMGRQESSPVSPL